MADARHFKNAAARAKFNRGEITMDEATTLVPVKRAMDRRSRKQLIGNMNYARKVNDPRWIAHAAEAKMVKEGKVLPRGQTGHE